MARRLLLLAIVLATGIAPVAHELCQLSCKAPAAASSQTTPSAHEHCALQAAANSSHAATQLSAFPSSNCLDQYAPVMASAFAKIAIASPALIPNRSEMAGDARVEFSQPISVSPPSIVVPARTQLRV